MAGFNKSLSVMRTAQGQFRMALANEFSVTAAIFTEAELRDVLVTIEKALPQATPVAVTVPDRWNPGVDCNGRVWPDEEALIVLFSRGNVCFPDGGVYSMERSGTQRSGYVLDAEGRRVMKLRETR